MGSRASRQNLARYVYRANNAQGVLVSERHVKFELSAARYITGTDVTTH